MKKKIFTIITIFTLLATSSFAYSDGIDKNVLNNFSSKFANATDVTWEKINTYYKASFWMNGLALNAVFAKDGHIIAVTRNIISTELPTQLHESLGNNFPNYWITDLFQYTTHGETKYYVTIENSDEKEILESIGSIEWSVFKKITK
ncbi:hypothetical protein [Flavihumibacter profundi]|uniref:hypothetical protein n=1 Tax=Flavihumibacter profundi TaxID=2716883 RepID=UPI001CC40CC0|nr:hypothetical protein [Flavihumibacter profundi]MBZ5855617.1 hypothetical protein [Flavihumibacter profundi]